MEALFKKRFGIILKDSMQRTWKYIAKLLNLYIEISNSGHIYIISQECTYMVLFSFQESTYWNVTADNLQIIHYHTQSHLYYADISWKFIRMGKM